MPRFIKVPSAVDFGERSPFSRHSMIGLPPHGVQPPKLRVHADGRISVQGVPLPAYTEGKPESGQDLTPIPGETPVRPLPMYDPQFYGDAITIPVVFAAAGELLVLRRPNATRISLLIVNSTVVANIFYAFDRVADNLSSVPIAAGGNRLFDFSVPQGDLHVFSTGAGTVIIEYMNRDIRQESYR